ncbi:MAG: cytochrome d ubiquinol oxidase subunit II [Actinomycetota bacterium]|nr:cytochrome d ubiquinol oxidase subunit II [Actinomycetota bacterium]
MSLVELPLVFALAGMAIYTVLAGADFGAGFWQLTAGQGPDATRLREHAYHVIGPVWEANHVWLVFVLTVVWTAYPLAFASIASTLTVPLFIAAVGIILRGAAYALHSGTSVPRERRVIDTMFSFSSILTPFALGAAVGGIASQRVPVGNAAGDLLTSWLNPTSLLIGVLAVAVGAYLAAVYLAADALRQGVPDLETRFRTRALGASVVAGVLALGGLVILRTDAPTLYQGLIGGDGLAGLAVSVLAGLVTLLLVWRRRYTLGRFTAALAVAAILAGWGLAQRPVFLPGLTVAQAAAPEPTLIAVVVAVLAGGLILAPSLALLFRLVLGGRFDPGGAQPAPATPAARQTTSTRGRAGLLLSWAVTCLAVGVGLLSVVEIGWAHAVGVVALFGFIVLAFLGLAPADEDS